MKLAVVGLDSADWRLLDRWLHHLPNIAAIRRGGLSAPLRSCRPPVTVPAWKCYSTGRNPGKLGVFWFARPDFDRRRLHTHLPGDIGGNLWDYIPNSLVINTPGTFPLRNIDGVLVAGFPCPEGQPFVSPSAARASLGDYRVNSRVPPGEPGFPEEVMDLIELRFDTFRRLAPRFDFGQVTIFYIDEMHHLYGSDSQVLEAWRLIDERIGEIMSLADNVVLVSDHGSGPMKHFVNAVPALQELGAFRVRPPWPGADLLAETDGSLASKAATLGQRLLPPKLRDALWARLAPMQEWLPGAQEQFRVRVDWSSSVLPLNQGLVYRNPTVQCEDRLWEDVVARLGALPGVRRVWRRNELYHGPFLDRAPDLWIEAEPGVEVVARFDQEWETKPPVRGEGWIVNHREEGIVGFWGRDVCGEALADPSLFDLCPTLLSLFGIPAPPGVDGRVLPVSRAASTSREEPTTNPMRG